MESTDLIKKARDHDRLKLALAIALPDGTPPVTIAATAEGMGLSIADLTELLNDKKFQKLVQGITKARASIGMHGVGIKRLLEIAATGSNKDAMQAIKLLGTITGDLNQKIEVDIRHTFEDLRRQYQQAGATDDLSGLFSIRRPDVVDAEVLDE